MSRGFHRMGVVFAVAVLAGGMAETPILAGPLEPMQFGPIGSLALSTPGTYTFDTTGTIPTLVVGNTTYTGIISNGTAVFDFSSITVANGVTLTAVKGNGLPIALLSQSSVVINGRIDVSAFGGSSGPGAGNTGVGGNGGVINTSPFATVSGAGGGGFAGAGGMGGNNGTLSGGAGGASTFVPLISKLEGGSSGGGVGFSGGGGGGGAGALEIGAFLNISIGGEIDAIGADGVSGGGGSGGGIFLHASSVEVTGTLDVQGGAGVGGNNGQSPYPGSGGGGGGRIEVLYSTPGSYAAGTTILNGGAGGAFGGQSGANGTIGSLSGYTPAVPEPSSLLMLGTSTLGFLGAAAFKRSRNRRSIDEGH